MTKIVLIANQNHNNLQMGKLFLAIFKIMLWGYLLYAFLCLLFLVIAFLLGISS